MRRHLSLWSRGAVAADRVNCRKTQLDLYKTVLLWYFMPLECKESGLDRLNLILRLKQFSINTLKKK